MIQKHILNQVNKDCDDIEILNKSFYQKSDLLSHIDKMKIEKLSKTVKYDLELLLKDYNFKANLKNEGENESFNEMLEKTIKRFSSLTDSSKELCEEIVLKNSFEKKFFDLSSKIIDYYSKNNIMNNNVVNKNLNEFNQILNDAKKIKFENYSKCYNDDFIVRISYWSNCVGFERKKPDNSEQKFIIYGNNIAIIDFPSSDYFITIWNTRKSLNIEESESESNKNKNKNNCIIS